MRSLLPKSYITYLAISLLCLIISSSAFAQKHSRRKVARHIPMQGICGTVVVKQGNHMPSPDRPTPTGQPTERDVLIFPLLNMSQVDAGDNGFINSVREAKPVKTVKSDKNGKFCVTLPIGKYSVVVREPKGLYANLSDTENNIFPVNVTKNHQSDVKVEITHGAVF